MTTRACFLAIAVTAALARTGLAIAERPMAPSVPAEIAAPATSEAFFAGRATGTQDYVCLPAASGFAWTLFTPQATLYTSDGRQATTHYFSPNPAEGGTVRATWQHSGDGSIVWGRAVTPSTNPAFVSPGAIPWVLLEVVGTRDGRGEAGALAGTTYVQRVNTRGGNPPAAGCAVADDVGKKVFVDYTADYYFYRRRA